MSQKDRERSDGGKSKENQSEKKEDKQIIAVCQEEVKVWNERGLKTERKEHAINEFDKR